MNETQNRGKCKLDDIQSNYSHSTGGTRSDHFEEQDTNRVTQYTRDTTYKLGENGQVISGHLSASDGYDEDITNDFPVIALNWELGTLSAPPDRLGETYTKTSKVKVSLHIGGKASGQAIVQVVSGIGTEQMQGFPYAMDIAPGDLTVEGLGQTLGADRQAYGTAAIGSTVNVNLDAGVPDHTFGDGAGSPKIYIMASSSTTNADLDSGAPEFCVGQQVNFELVGLLPLT